MDASSLTSLPELVSPARFGRYLSHYDGRVDLAARLYAWNIEATAAFWGPISVLEVVLRNAMHNALRQDHREDWWDGPDLSLLPAERKMIDDAIAKLAREGKTAPTPGQVVAASNFALWTRLTGAGIARHPVYSYETSLWQPRLVRAFPHLGNVRRKQLHRELNDIRYFRNRLAHHEPIFAASLEQIRDDILRVAAYIYADAVSFIQGCSRIDEVLERKQLAIGSGDNRF